MTAYLGIDPGLSGALVLMDGRALEVADVPTFTLTRNAKNKREIDVQQLADIVEAFARSNPLVFIENSTPMPQQGSASTFAFGKAFGIILGVCAANKLVIERIAPQRWKRALLVPKDKDGARARASQLLPAHAHNWRLHKHDGRAEAALLALYGARQSERSAA